MFYFAGLSTNIPRPILELNDHISKHSEEYAAEDDIWSAEFWSDFAKGTKLDDKKTADNVISKEIQLTKEEKNQYLTNENIPKPTKSNFKPIQEPSCRDDYLDYLIDQLERPANYTQHVNTSRHGKAATITSAQATNIVPTTSANIVKTEMASPTGNLYKKVTIANQNLLEIPHISNNLPIKKRLSVLGIKDDAMQPSTSKQKKIETQVNRGEVNITKEEEQIWLKLLPMFPDGCPDYLKSKCKGKTNTPAEIEGIIMDLIDSKYFLRQLLLIAGG